MLNKKKFLTSLLAFAAGVAAIACVEACTASKTPTQDVKVVVKDVVEAGEAVCLVVQFSGNPAVETICQDVDAWGPLVTQVLAKKARRLAPPDAGPPAKK